MTWLLDNHVWIIGLLVVIMLSVSEARSFMKRKNLTFKEFIGLMRERLNKALGLVMARLGASAVVTLAVSLISFRELWINDVFHAIFVASLLLPTVESKLRDLLD